MEEDNDNFNEVKIEDVNPEETVKYAVLIAVSLIIGFSLNTPLTNLFFGGISGSWVLKLVSTVGVVLFGIAFGVGLFYVIGLALAPPFFLVPNKIGGAWVIAGGVLGLIFSSMIVLLLADYWLALLVSFLVGAVIYLYGAKEGWF